MQPEFCNDKRPAGVPNDIDLGAYRSVVEVFERACKTHADRPAFSNMGVTLSYSDRSEEHTSELQSLMRISYAVFCLKKKTTHDHNTYPHYTQHHIYTLFTHPTPN